MKIDFGGGGMINVSFPVRDFCGCEYMLAVEFHKKLSEKIVRYCAGLAFPFCGILNNLGMRY